MAGWCWRGCGCVWGCGGFSGWAAADQVSLSLSLSHTQQTRPTSPIFPPLPPPPHTLPPPPPGFNTGSTYLYNTPSPVAAQRAAMNTTLAASSSGLVTLLLGSWLGGTYDLRLCCNGVLSGLVTVTAMCGFVDPYAAAVCGVIAGGCYIGCSHLMVRWGGRWVGGRVGCSRSW
jgi:hypothetical protein